MKGFAGGSGALAALLWIVFGVTLIIFLTAGDGGYLAEQMLKNAPPETTGLPEAEYAGVGEMTAGYLTGRTNRFQYLFPNAAGDTIVCFNEREAAHMADCRALIRLDRTVMILSGAGALVLLGAGILTRRNAETFCRGMIWGLRIALAAAAVLAAWAMADFDGFFVTFHRIAFTNDGWLLDPRKDLLIRLMPEHFFISLGIRGAMWAVIPPAALETAARLGIRRMKRKQASSDDEVSKDDV